MRQWGEVREFLVSEATADLEAGLEINPCLVAFAGDVGLFIAFLRSFAKGDYADPIIELVALAAPMGADRLALSMGARAWSLDDPIPPVLEGVGDLRQRVLCITEVDGTRDPVSVEGAVFPFTMPSTGRVVWGDPLAGDGGEGWIPGALRLAVERRGTLKASPRDIRRQAGRCERLGHLLAFSDAGAAVVQPGGHRSAR